MGLFKTQQRADFAVKPGATIDIEAGGTLKVAGVTLTPSAADYNALPGIVAATTALKVFSVTATTAEVNAGTKVIVPAVAGKQFLPLDVWMQALGGNAADATLVRLVEETSSAVVMSHVIADMTEDTWVGKTGGTVVTTALGFPLVAAKAILIDKTGSALATCTHVRAVVVGCYV